MCDSTLCAEQLGSDFCQSSYCKDAFVRETIGLPSKPEPEVIIVEEVIPEPEPEPIVEPVPEPVEEEEPDCEWHCRSTDCTSANSDDLSHCQVNECIKRCDNIYTCDVSLVSELFGFRSMKCDDFKHRFIPYLNKLTFVEPEEIVEPEEPAVCTEQPDCFMDQEACPYNDSKHLCLMT